MADNDYGDWGRDPLRDRLKARFTGNVDLRAMMVKAGLAAEREAVESTGPRWFKYSAISAQGVRHKGKMQGPSSIVVSEVLQADGWIPLSIEEVLQGGLNTDIGSALGGTDVRLSITELATFARQVSELLRAGVPLVRALTSLGEEQSPTISRICTDLATQIASGVSLSESLKQFPKVFDGVFRSYVQAGEMTGNLAGTMARLAKTVEKQATMAQKIKGVTAYPKFVSIAIGAVVTGIIVFMVPMYAKIYASFDAPLPGPTRVLMQISSNIMPFNFTRSFPLPWFLSDPAGLTTLGLLSRIVAILMGWLLMEGIRVRRGKSPSTPKMVVRGVVLAFLFLGGYNYHYNIATFIFWGAIIGGIVFFNSYKRRNANNVAVVKRINKARFKSPLFGRIWQLNALYRWATTLAGALSSGVPMTSALELAGGTSGSNWHLVVARELQAVIRSGKPLSEGLAMESELYPPSLRAMVATGEQTGDLATMMESVATAIDAETDALVAGLAAKIEVTLLIAMAVVVGGLLMVLYLPILNLAAQGFN